MKYWLLKSEPDEFSLNDLAGRPNKTEPWDGIRNYQARNFIRDEMNPGDLAFFYHSNCKEPGIVGVVKIASVARLDPGAFDAKSRYYDPKSSPDKPRWYVVDVKYQKHLKRPIRLQELRTHRQLEKMKLLQKGNRLSIMPITKEEWEYILSLK
jgi:predicted RNA-binding protein with PUA-like domain